MRRKRILPQKRPAAGGETRERIFLPDIKPTDISCARIYILSKRLCSYRSHLERAASSATMVTSGCICRIEAGT